MTLFSQSRSGVGSGGTVSSLAHDQSFEVEVRCASCRRFDSLSYADGQNLGDIKGVDSGWLDEDVEVGICAASAA